MNKYLDMGFEVIATGMEMIDAVIEAHQELYGNGEAELKSDHPATFGQSLYEDKEASQEGIRR